MFDKFGEFDSAEELNRAAAAQKEEGDYEAIYAIAKENGIDREDAQDYIDDLVPELASPEMAAYGKLDIEEADLKPYYKDANALQYKITIRYRQDITEKDILVYNGRQFEINSIININEDNVALEIYCTESKNKVIL